jgi:hypothetical protein
MYAGDEYYGDDVTSPLERVQAASYTLIPVPGVELGACPFCPDTHAPGKCPVGAALTGEPLIARLRAELDEARARERAAGADMVAIVNAASAYLAVMTWSPAQDKSWKPGKEIPDYRTPENRLRKLLAGPARPGVELLADVAEPAKTINDLRAKLDTALSHIGALVAAVSELDSLGEWIWSKADKATLLSIHLREAHHTELIDRMFAARAWLRRGAR